MDFEISINEKLSLKLRHEKDTEDCFLVVDKNREELRKWLPWVDATVSSEDTMKFITKRQEEFAKKESADFGVRYDGAWIGSMGFNTIDSKNEWAEIGYWLDGDHVGKGIMTECVKAMLRYGFDNLKLHRIRIRCDALNTRSKAIPERLGFKLEGVLREDHKHQENYSDGLIYGLLASEYKKVDFSQ